MTQDKLLNGALLFALGLILVAASATQAQSKQATKKKAALPSKPVASESKPVLEPRALEIIKASSDRLAAAHTLMFTAVESYETPSRQGHPLVLVNKSEITVQRPDKLRVITPGDGPASEFYYDGKNKKMMAFAPSENLLAVADAPPTIDAALEAAFHSSGTYFPFTDLIVADPYKDWAPGVVLAYYVGQSRIVGDTTTDIVAYVGDGVFEEIWIGVEDKLPRLVHAIYLDDPDQVRHNLLLSNWKLDVAVPADAFAPSDAANAKRIPFAHPHPEPPTAAKNPATRTEPATPKQ